MSTERRVGQGTDRHRLAPDEPLVLAGVSIDCDVGTLGHSDGDVLVHALIDALLGAAGLGDIGQHFPDTDEQWSDANSLKLLDHTVGIVADTGWTPINLDATVRLESVKLAPYRGAMVEELRAILPDDTAVNVKFTTAEGLGPVGEEEAIEATAVCLLKPHND